MTKRRGTDDKVKLETLYKDDPTQFTFPDTPWNKDDDALRDLPDTAFTGVHYQGEDVGCARCNLPSCLAKRFSDQDRYKL